MIKCFALFFCLIAFRAEAAPIKTTLVVLHGPRERTDLHVVMSRVRAKWEPMPGRLKIARVVHSKTLYADCGLSQLSRFYSYASWYCLKAELIRRGILRARKITLVIAPPMYQEGDERWFLAGLADFAAYRSPRYMRARSMAMVWCADKRSNGQDAFEHCVIGAAHELAHNVGARHFDEYPNIMHSDALRFAECWDLSFASPSISQVKKYLSKVNKGG